MFFHFFQLLLMTFPVFSFLPSPHVTLDCRFYFVFIGLAAPPLPDPLPLVDLWVGWRLAPSLPTSGEFG